jgi:transcriptional regulator with GAF, ATPase, and Fis domain
MQTTVGNNTLNEIDALNKEAWNVKGKNDEKAMELASLALEKATEINYSVGIAHAKKTIGTLYIWMAENEKGAQFCFEAISIFKTLNDKANEALVYVNLGTNFYFLSDYDTAMRYYKTSFDLASEIKDGLGMASALNGIGAVYCAIEQYDKALDPLLQSEKLSIENKARERLITVQDSIAETYLKLNDYTKALEYYSKCYTLSKDIQSKQSEAYALNGLGNTHTALKDYEKAVHYFNKCLEIRKEIGFKFGEAVTLNDLGNLYLKKNDLENATKFLKQAYDNSAQVGSKEGIYQSSEKLAELYEKLGETTQALHYYKIYHQAKEDVRNHKSAQLSKSFELQNKVLQSQAERTILEERAKELENYSSNLVLMGEIGQKIISQLNVSDIVETVYGQVNRLMDATGFGIGIFKEDKGEIVFPVFIEGGEKFSDIKYDIADKQKLSVMCFEKANEIIINDFDAEIDKYFKASAIPTFGKKALSLIYLPLFVKGKTVGVITVQSFRTNAYSPYQVNVLRNLASYTAIALENATIYEEQDKKIAERTTEVIQKKDEVERAYQNNKLLSELGQQITSTLNFEEIFNKLYNCVSSLMDAGFFGIDLLDLQKNVIEYKYGIERGVRLKEIIEVPLTAIENYSVICVSTKKEIFINDLSVEYKKYTKQINVVSGEMPYSMIFYPILMGDKVLGCVSVQSFTKHAYTDYHLDILKTLATYTAIAIENANLFELMEEKVAERTLEVVKQKEEIERTYKSTKLLGTIGNDITSTLSVNDIIDKVYANLNTLMDASVLGIGIYDENKKEMLFPGSIEKGKKLPAHSYFLDKNPERPAIKTYVSQEDYVVNDYGDYLVRSGKLKQKPIAGENTESIIYLPVTHNNKRLGVITVQSFKANAYTEYHVQIVKNMAVYVAIAIENANLYTNLEERVIERTEEIKATYQNSKLLSELGQQITSTLNLEDIFAKLYSYLSGLMDTGNFGVRLYNQKRNVIEYKYGIEKGARLEEMEVSMEDVDNYSVWCVLNKKEVFINDNQKEYSKYVRRIRVVSGDLPHSLIFYPVMIGERVLGCITVQSFEYNAYTDYHLDILKSLATYTAIAMENANLFELMEEKVKERTLEVTKQKEEIERTYTSTKLLGKIGNDITSTRSVDEIIDKVYVNLNTLMDAAGFGIGVYRPEQDQIQFPLYIEGDQKYDNVSYSANEKDKLACICMNQRKDIVINDFKNEIEQYVGYVQAPLQGKVVESIIYLPLILKDKTLGVITVQSFSKNAYKSYHVEILRNLAVYVAIAIDNANLYTGLEERVNERTKEINTAYENNRLLSEIGQQITSTLNFEDVFERLHKYIYQLMDAESFGVRVYHKETDTIEYKYEIEKLKRDHQGKTLPADPNKNFSAWVIKNKKEIILHDFKVDYKKYLKEATLVGGDTPESAVMVPIALGDRVLGAITVQSFRKNAYTDYHADILKNLATYTAIAFDNSALYETMEEKVNERTAEVVLQKEEIEKTYENTRILSQIGKDISNTFSIQEIISKVYPNLNTLMDATCFGIGVYREKSNELVFPATIERRKTLMPYTYSVKDTDRPAIWCYSTQSDYIINNFSEEFVKNNKVQDYQAKEGDNPESIIYVPITQSNKKIGVITVQSFKAHAYKEYHLQIVKSLAVYVAIALDNVSLYNNLEDRVRERTEEIEKNYNDTRLLGEISKELSSSLSIETIISSVYKNIHQLMKADSFGIGIFNSKKQTIDFNGFRENQTVLDPLTIDVNDQNRLGAICFKQKVDIIINDFITEHSKYIKLERKPIRGNDNMSVIYLPLISKGEPIGVITVQSLDKDSYSEYQVNILQNLAVSIGIALDNAALYETLEDKVKERTLEVVKQKEEVERTYENTRLLSEIGKEISSTLSIEAIITKVYDHINKLMDAAALGIGIYREVENDLYHPCIIEKGKKLQPFSYTLDMDRIAVKCLKEGKEFIINDWIAEHKKYIAVDAGAIKGEDPQSVIYMPLTSKDKIIGVLSVQSFETNAYKEYHLDILRNLAIYIASAIGTANLYQSMEDSVEKRTEEIRIAYENTRLLGEMAEDISSSLSVETIISKVYQNVNKIMKADCFGIGMYNESNNLLEFKGFVENDQLMDDFAYPADDRKRLASVCFIDQRDLVINDYTVEYSNYFEGMQAPVSGKDSSSIIYLPLYSKEKIVGVITVQSFERNVYTDYHYNILKGIAVSVGTALDNANLYQNLEEKVNERTKEVVKQKEEIEKANENTRLLSQIGKDITSTLSIPALIEKVYSNVNSLMDATGFGIGVYNKETEQIVFPSYIESGEKFDAFAYDKDDMNRLTNVCFFNNREIMINNFLKEIKHYISNYEPPLKGQQVESILYLPLILNDKRLGVITVQSFKRNAYKDNDLQMLKNLAVYVAIAIDNASLYENMEQRVVERTKEVTQQKEQLEKNFNDTKLIAQISKVITASLSVETIVSMAYENINNLMNAESFGIGLYNDKTKSLQFHGFIERAQKMDFFEFFLTEKDRFAVWCFDREQEMLMNDVQNDYKVYIKDLGKPIAGDAPQSVIYMPLFSKGKKIGVITVQSFTKNAFSEYQLNILRNIANSVAIAVDNAALYENLEEKVKERTDEVFTQKAIIEAKNKDITDSIQYAKKIQLALMSETQLFSETFKDSFVLFRPKDIVSGDFYWATKKIAAVINEKGELENHEMVYLAVCDSTGHGVPGAFMSLLNISYLNEAINEKNLTAPNEVFNFVRNKLITNISKEGQKDGFDGTLLCVNKTTGEVTYSSALNSPILVSEKTMIELKCDRMPVGYGERQEKFSLNTVNVKKGDRLYIYTDGYADQFGGPRGKKFMSKKLNEFIHSISGLSLSKQSELLVRIFEDWKGNLEQIDDVCIIGLKF